MIVVDRGKNEDFLARTAKYAERKKWTHLLAAFKTGLGKLNIDINTTQNQYDASQAAIDLERINSHKAASTSTAHAAEDQTGSSAMASKKRRVAGAVMSDALRVEWTRFAQELDAAERAANAAEGKNVWGLMKL